MHISGDKFYSEAWISQDSAKRIFEGWFPRHREQEVQRAWGKIIIWYFQEKGRKDNVADRNVR
jgi:hypothetical protein